ncbi:MAG: DUF3971 domain-containing protein, partial [Candidatus Schekmanbacteria bacterium]
YLNVSDLVSNSFKREVEKIGLNVDCDKIIFSPFPRPTVNLQKIKISDLKTSEELISAENIRISVKIFPLLIGKVKLGTVVLNSPFFSIQRDNEGTFLLPTFLKKKESKEDAEKQEKRKEVELFAESFEIINGNVTFIDNYFDRQKRLFFYGIDFTIHKKPLLNQYAFVLSFLLKIDTEKPAFFEFKGGTDEIINLSSIALDTKAVIRSLNPESIKVYFGKYLPFEGISKLINANLQFETASLKDGFKMSGYLELIDLNLTYRKFFLAPVICKKVSINFSLEKKPYEFAMPFYQANFENFSVNGAVKVNKINENERRLYLNFSSKDFPYDDYGKRFIPYALFKPNLRNFLLNKLKGGRIELRNLTINEVLHKDKSKKYPKKPDFLTLDATGKGVSLYFGKFFKPAAINSGTIKIENGRAIFLNCEGKYGKGRWNLISGEIHNLYEKGNLSVKAKSLLPSKELIDFLRNGPLPNLIKGEAEKVYDSYGNAELNLTISKILKDKTSPINYAGRLMFNNITAYHKEFSGQFDIRNTLVNFSNKRIELKIKNIEYRNSHILLSGVVIPSSYRGEKRDIYCSIGLEGSISSSLLNELMEKSGNKDILFKGYSRFKSVFEQRSADDINYTFESDISDLSIRYKSLFIKDPLMPSKVLFYINYLPNDSFLIKKGSEIVIDNNKFSLNGEYRKKRNYPFHLNIHSKDTDLKNLSKNIPPLEQLKAEGKADFRIHFNLSENGNIKTKTSVKLNAISSKIGLLNLVKKASGIVEREAGNIVFRNFKVKALNSSLLIDGGIDSEANENNVVLNIRTDYFDLDKFLKKYPQQRTHKPTGGKGKNITFDCMFESLQTVFLGNIYEKISADFTYEKKELDIKHLEGTSFGGGLNLSGKIDFSSNESAFSICSQTKNTDIDKLLSYLGLKGSEINGRVDIDNCLDSKWKDSTEIKPNLAGQIHFVSKNGRIKKTSIGIFSKILSFFNLLKWKDFWIKDIETKGMTYNTINADFTGADGVFHTDNFLLDGSSMKISAVGDIDVGKNTINMKVGVMPLGTVDTIVSNIPIVGYILTGKDKSLVTAYFEVKGDIKNPKVEPISMKSLGKGLLGIFRRTLGFPYDIIKDTGSNESKTPLERRTNQSK